MRYKIKQANWGVGNYNYDIMDGDGKVLCQLKEEFNFLNEGNVLDLSGHLLAHISQRLLSLTSEFDITVAGQAPTVVKTASINPIHPTFTIKGPSGSYQLEGDWNSGNYAITKEGQPVAQVSVESSGFLGVQRCYTVDIAEGADIPTLLCVVIVMDEQGYKFIAA